MTASSGLSAKQRRSALEALSRDVLAELTESFELEVDDRRVKQGHVDAIINSRSLSFRELLEMLKRAELKAMCEALGLSTKGRAKLPIVDRILSMGESDSDSGAAQVAVPGIELERAPSPKKAKKEAAKQAAAPPLLAFASGPPGSPKMGLRRFALRAAAGYRGKSGGETFARELLACFGVEDGAKDGPVFGHPISVVDAGKRGTRELTLYWPSRRVVLEVVDRDLTLDLAWSDLLRACLQMDSEPQYVVLTNQRDVRLYDLAKDRGAPRLSRALDELPKYSEAFVFFEPDWVPGSTPKIINDEKVSKEVADLVAKVYRVLKAKNPERDDAVIRFTLQCIIAMFAEDIGLLPKEYFTTLLYQAAEKGDAKKRLGELFKAMSTKGKNEDGIPYFNGGLFTDPVTLEIGTAPLRALTKAAEANWRYVDPHIFGSVFQGIMGDAERHASGAHYTAREDIMSVVGPTIVEPWRERISSASTLTELRAILTDLGTYRVLDPACGSGNFLYVAFRELYKLETEVLCRIYEDFASEREGSKRTSWVSSIHAKNFFGIDINPFAVELAKTTLNIAKKVAFDERMETVRALFGQGVLEVDPSLPLDNLDDTILVKDAVFSKWEAADAIIGNPPFLGEKRMRGELGVEYAREVQASFPGFGGDLCAVWFRKAHQLLKEGGRVGFVQALARDAHPDPTVKTFERLVAALKAEPHFRLTARDQKNSLRWDRVEALERELARRLTRDAVQRSGHQLPDLTGRWVQETQNFQKRLLVQAWDECGGDVARTARRLGLTEGDTNTFLFKHGFLSSPVPREPKREPVEIRAEPTPEQATSRDRRFSLVTLDGPIQDTQVVLEDIVVGLGDPFVDAWPLPPRRKIRLRSPSRRGYRPEKIAIDLVLAGNADDYLDVRIQFYLTVDRQGGQALRPLLAWK